MDDLIAVSGVELGVANANLNGKEGSDLLVIKVAEGSNLAGVFTQNSFRAAPVQISSDHIRSANSRALIVNTGSANAGTGEVGWSNAMKVCGQLARKLSISTNQVLPFSTGVIMEHIKVSSITEALPLAVAGLKENNWRNAAEAIMTTDTISKGYSKKILINETEVTFTGIAKGSGMIKPNMATMLAFIATDACIEKDALRSMLSEIVNTTFNCITVDGETSTNDSFILIATGHSGVSDSRASKSGYYSAVYNTLQEVAIELAKMIVKDGEGSTKLVNVLVKGGRKESECRQVGFSIAESPLVKTAFFASDPNVGRILAAVGNSGVSDLDVSKITVLLDNLKIFENGSVSSEYSETKASLIMQKEEFCLIVDLKSGSAVSSLWTCDLSHDYVTINSEYRS